MDPFKKDNVHQKEFLENFDLLVVKNHFHIQFVDNIWLKCLVM
jgi:hypothetical protein